MKICVTTSTRLTTALEAEARAISQVTHLPYVNRQKMALHRLWQDWDGALVLSKENLVLEQAGGQKLFFHPDTAMLRIKAGRDALLDLVGSDPKTILDCTMGLASDSLVLAAAGHQVKALEANPIIHFLVAYGLEHYKTDYNKLRQALGRLRTQQIDSLTYLQEQPDNSVDMIYFDPMFSEKIVESDNLDGLVHLADSSRLTRELFKEAKRVARHKIILKAHFRDSAFEDLGMIRLVRPNQKFHYGYLNL